MESRQISAPGTAAFTSASKRGCSGANFRGNFLDSLFKHEPFNLGPRLNRPPNPAQLFLFNGKRKASRLTSAGNRNLGYLENKKSRIVTESQPGGPQTGEPQRGGFRNLGAWTG